MLFRHGTNPIKAHFKYNALLKALTNEESCMYFNNCKFVGMFMKLGNTAAHDQVWIHYYGEQPDGKRKVTIQVANGNYGRDFDEVKVFEYDTGILVFDIFQPYEYFRYDYATLDTTFEY